MLHSFLSKTPGVWFGENLFFLQASSHIFHISLQQKQYLQNMLCFHFNQTKFEISIPYCNHLVLLCWQTRWCSYTVHIIDDLFILKNEHWIPKSPLTFLFSFAFLTYTVFSRVKHTWGQFEALYVAPGTWIMRWRIKTQPTTNLHYQPSNSCYTAVLEQDWGERDGVPGGWNYNNALRGRIVFQFVVSVWSCCSLDLNKTDTTTQCLTLIEGNVKRNSVL